jgi:hypothetical protein
MLPLSSDETPRQWAARLGGSAEETARLLKLLLSFRAELEVIHRDRVKGNTTIKVVHPEGRIKKAFLNDREI